MKCTIFVLCDQIIGDTEYGSADCKIIVYFVYERKMDERSDKLDKVTIIVSFKLPERRRKLKPLSF